MRRYIILAAVAAIAAFPCAWDTPSGELAPLAAMLAGGATQNHSTATHLDQTGEPQ
jgi:hypothetical protein